MLKWHPSSEDLTDWSNLEEGDEKTFKYASRGWRMVNTHLFWGLICSILHTYQCILCIVLLWACCVGGWDGNKWGDTTEHTVVFHQPHSQHSSRPPPSTLNPRLSTITDNDWDYARSLVSRIINTRIWLVLKWRTTTPDRKRDSWNILGQTYSRVTLL